MVVSIYVSYEVISIQMAEVFGREILNLCAENWWAIFSESETRQGILRVKMGKKCHRKGTASLHFKTFP